MGPSITEQIFSKPLLCAGPWWKRKMSEDSFPRRLWSGEGRTRPCTSQPIKKVSKGKGDGRGGKRSRVSGACAPGLGHAGRGGVPRMGLA